MGQFKSSWLGVGLLAVGLVSGCVSPAPRPKLATAAPPPVVAAIPQPAATPAAPAPSITPPVNQPEAPPPIIRQPAPVAPATPALPATPLDRFMADRPAAAALLRQHPPLAEWFRSEWNQPGAFRILWDNQPPSTSPVAENTSSSQDRSTTIRVSPNLSPVDQLMGLFYETCNAGGRTRIIALGAMATQGKISRQDFVEGIEMAEFTANRTLKETFPELLPLSRAQLAGDQLYQNVLDTPDTYAEYKSRNIRNHNENYLNAHELYGREYDELVKRAPPARPLMER